MSSQDLYTKDRAEAQSRLLIARYGSHRSAVGSILFAWVNLSLLIAFGWASLVVAFDAPSVSVELLPVDWFVIRFIIILAAAALTVVLWRGSMAPTGAMSREAVEGLFQRGVLWSQGMLFLVGVSLVLGGLLLLANPNQASKLLLYGVVEVFAVQALFAGYLKTAFDLLFERRRAFILVTGLFTVFFGLQSLSVAMTAVNAEPNYYLAFVAGGALGAAVGIVSLILRDRSGSIVPGFFVQLLVFYLFIPFVE